VKILITGSRQCNDSFKITSILNNEIKDNDVLIHGGAIGVDTIVNNWVLDQRNKNRNISQVIIRPARPEIKEYYLHRNAEMIGMCDRVIAFWNGKSRGTEFTIKYATLRNLNVLIVKI
jgi:hypothetical protein